MKTLKGYIRLIRRQPKHMQHVYGIIFAGSITSVIAGFILYTDYGFWHEKYKRIDDVSVITTTPTPEPPSEMLSRFWNEAQKQFKNIGVEGASILEGKESYTR